MTKAITSQTVAVGSSNPVANKASIKTSLSTSSFSKVMDQNINSEKDISKSQVKSEKSSNQQNVTSLKKGVIKKDVAKKDEVKKDEVVKKDVKDSEDQDVLCTDENVQNKENVQTDSMDGVSNPTTGVEDILATKVKDILELSDEELENILAEMGLTMTDLLNPMNLQKLILEVNQATDITQALTNEELGSDLSKLMQELENLQVEEQPITEKEVQQLLEELPKSENVIWSAESVEVADKMTKQSKETVKDTMNMVDGNEMEPKVEISVAKDTNQTDMAQTNMGSSDTTQNDKPSESLETKETLKLSPFETIVQNLEVAGKQNVQETLDSVASLKQMREIVNQVVEQIRVSIKPDSSSMEIQLNPENLGKVNLTVTSTNGALTANFVTQNEVAKQALESQMIILKDNLVNQGIKVDSIEVTVSNFSFEQSTYSDNKQQESSKSSKRSINLSGLESDYDDLSEDDMLAADIMMQNGNTVDYSA